MSLHNGKGQSSGKPRLSYYCHSLGTPDHDRCNALADDYDVVAYDWSRDNGYVWSLAGERRYVYEKLEVRAGVKKILDVIKLLSSTIRDSASISIYYGYHNPAFFLCAIVGRALRRLNITMLDSKFDDYRRNLFSDIPKSILLTPYHAYLAASERSVAYANYLKPSPTNVYYCAIDTHRISENARTHYNAIRFKDRAFIMVARFVPKKNHMLALRAYERYLARAKSPHRMIFYGYGPLEADLRQAIAASDLLSTHVTLSGFVPSAQIPEIMARGLALILPSTEEQFGIVTTECLSSGVPVIISKQCGSADLVVNGGNGYVMNSFEEDELASYMHLVSNDEGHWRQLSIAAPERARMADVSEFRKLVGAASSRIGRKR